MSDLATSTLATLGTTLAAAPSYGPQLVFGQLTLAHYLFVSGAMFALGLIGFITRRNLIVMFLCTELMFQAAGLALVAFGRYHLNFDGQTFVIFVLTVAAAEAAMGLALVVLLFRRRESLSADEWKDMSG